MEPVKNSTGNKFLVTLFILTFLAAIGACYYRYYHQKDYNYLVEASCDPTVERCFVRDCENPDDCPPNGLSVYKEFHVKAYDFARCQDNSCKQECESGTIRCEAISCEEETGGVCSEN